MTGMGGRLNNKTVLITGASRGVGRAIAERFAAEGANLALNARNADALEQAALALRTSHEVAITCHAADVTDAAAMQLMVSNIEAAAPIDILVNNAGIHIGSAFLDYSFEDFKRVMNVNVDGVFHVTQSVLRHMVARKAGRIVNIASTAGKWGSRNQSAYNASKHAVVGLTRCLGLEMAPHGIFVNAVCPWVIDTDMKNDLLRKNAEATGMSEDALTEALLSTVPIKRWIEPQEVAGLALYLASDEASYINGQAWTIDGGYTMI